MQELIEGPWKVVGTETGKLMIAQDRDNDEQEIAICVMIGGDKAMLPTAEFICSMMNNCYLALDSYGELLLALKEIRDILDEVLP